MRFLHDAWVTRSPKNFICSPAFVRVGFLVSISSSPELLQGGTRRDSGSADLVLSVSVSSVSLEAGSGKEEDVVEG